MRLMAAALGSSLVLGSTALLATAQDKAEVKKDATAKMLEAFAKDPIQIQNLGGNVSALIGPGGNITVLAGSKGTLVVDTGVPGRGPDISRAIKSITAAPIDRVIVTHWHFDHSGNTGYFAKAGANVQAHANVARQMSVAHEVAGMKIPASPAEELPTSSYDQSTKLTTPDGLEVDLIHPTNAHTDGDTAVYFREAKVLSTGDLFSSDRYPFIDVQVGGWIGGLIEAYDLLLSKIDAQAKVVPGHGPIATRAELLAYRGMMATIRDRIEAGITAGKTLDEIIASKPTRDVPASYGQHFIGHDDFTRLAYASLMAHRAGSKP
jgi:glyoxylase-like metal-dependent hydrolase (beta-lactamase superfamily II)